MDFFTIKNDQLVPSKEYQPQQPVVAYHPIGDGRLLVSNPLGEIDLVTAKTFATVLPQGVAITNGNTGNWWYNFSEHNLYFVDGVGSSDAKVRVLPVPPVTPGDVSMVWQRALSLPLALFH